MRTLSSQCKDARHGRVGPRHCAGEGLYRSPGYRRHRPEATQLYQLVAEHYAGFRDRRAAERRPLPRYVEDAFEAYLKCDLLEHGFLRVKCDACQAEKLVAFSCKRRGFCPSCGARRMAETAALLVEELPPRQPVRHCVLSLPFALGYLLATRPEIITQVLGIVYRAISAHLIRKAGLTRASAATGAVTLSQRFGSALNLNVHFHLLLLDGVYRREREGRLRFVPWTHAIAATERDEAAATGRQRAMSWAQCLKRVFAIDIETCRQCGGHLRVIASIEQPTVIEPILEHLDHTADPVDPAHPGRAPPKGNRLV